MGWLKLHLLDDLVAHPAIVAVLSAVLALGATWWLDHRAEQRAEQDRMIRMAESAVGDFTEYRLALEGAITAARRVSRAPEDVDLMARLGAAEDDVTRIGRDLSATRSARQFRLMRYVSGHGGSARPGAVDLFGFALAPYVAILETCTRELVGRTGSLSPAQFDAALTACDAPLRDTLIEDADETVPNPGARRGAALLSSRLAACEVATLVALDVTLTSPRQSGAMFGAVMARCGIAITDNGAAFAPPASLEVLDLS